jgi:hypothetical protein
VEDALQIHQLVPRAAEVIHDLLLPALDERRADAAGDVVQHLVPADALPLALPALPRALERIEDALGVLHLVERGGALGAVPAAAARMLGVTLELLDLERLLVDVGK